MEEERHLCSFSQGRDELLDLGREQSQAVILSVENVEDRPRQEAGSTPIFGGLASEVERVLNRQAHALHPVPGSGTEAVGCIDGGYDSLQGEEVEAIRLLVPTKGRRSPESMSDFVNRLQVHRVATGQVRERRQRIDDPERWRHRFAAESVKGCDGGSKRERHTLLLGRRQLLQPLKEIAAPQILRRLVVAASLMASRPHLLCSTHGG